MTGRRRAGGTAFQEGKPREQMHGNRTGGRPWSIQPAELLGAEKGAVGKEAPARVWRTLTIDLRPPGENREPLKTLEQRSDSIRPRFRVLPWGRVERDQETGSVTGGCGLVTTEWGGGRDRAGCQCLRGTTSRARRRKEAEEGDHQTGVPWPRGWPVRPSPERGKLNGEG